MADTAEPRERRNEGGNSNGDQASGSSNMFECNICLESPKDPVVSMCGHLFCWPCIHQWLETRPDRKMCPVCKAAIDHDKVVPLYGRGGSENVDPRTKPIPPRPQARRQEPEPAPGFNPFGGFGFGDFAPAGGGMNPGGLHVSFGIGAFPFFGTFFNLNTGPGNQQMEHDNYLGNLFLIITVIIILYMLLL